MTVKYGFIFNEGKYKYGFVNIQTLLRDLANCCKPEKYTKKIIDLLMSFLSFDRNITTH